VPFHIQFAMYREYRAREYLQSFDQKAKGLPSSCQKPQASAREISLDSSHHRRAPTGVQLLLHSTLSPLRHRDPSEQEGRLSHSICYRLIVIDMLNSSTALLQLPFSRELHPLLRSGLLLGSYST